MTWFAWLCVLAMIWIVGRRPDIRITVRTCDCDYDDDDDDDGGEEIDVERIPPDVDVTADDMRLN